MDPSYTQASLEAAIEYLALRIELESGIRQGVRSLLYKYALEIQRIAYKYKAKPEDFLFSNNPAMEQEVDALCEALVDELYGLLTSLVSQLADNDEDADYLLAYLSKLGNGTTDLRGQIEGYVSHFKKEMEAFAVAGFIAGYTYLHVANEYLANMKTPWTDPIITQAFTLPNVKAEKLRTRGAAFGRGRSNVSATLIETIGVGGLSLSWWQYGSMKMVRDGAIGYYQLRGGSYPCELCDAEVGYHPIEDEGNGYPHVHCKCYRVPVYGNSRDENFGDLNQ